MRGPAGGPPGQLAREPGTSRRTRLDPDAVGDQKGDHRRVDGGAEDHDGGGTVRAARSRPDGETAEPARGAAAVQELDGGAPDAGSGQAGGRAAAARFELSQGEAVRGGHRGAVGQRQELFVLDVDAGGGDDHRREKQREQHEADDQHHQLPGVVALAPGRLIRFRSLPRAPCALPAGTAHRKRPTSWVAEALSCPAFRLSTPLTGTNGSGTLRWTVTVTADPAARQSAGAQLVSTRALAAG